MLDIIKGHFNELFDYEGELSAERMLICKACPLLLNHPIKGLTCNAGLFINPETNEATEVYVEGSVRGCNCRLEAKTRLPDAHCPAGKW